MIYIIQYAIIADKLIHKKSVTKQKAPKNLNSSSITNHINQINLL